MPSVLEFELAGETMQAFADRALYWPARRRLFIADLHLGKGNIFRSAGIAVPTGGTSDDLDRLNQLLQRSGARELLILGDFLHGMRNVQVEQSWAGLAAAHPAVNMVVVAGNHDRALHAAGLGVELLPEGHSDGPFQFRHHPVSRPAPGAAHVLCGHVHPVVRVPTLPGRHPAFLVQTGQTVLPAFSRFTGGYCVEDRTSQWIACARDVLLANIR